MIGTGAAGRVIMAGCGLNRAGAGNAARQWHQLRRTRTMHEREIARENLSTLRDHERPLKERLYKALVGPNRCVGPPWPEDPEAQSLLGEVDRLMRQAPSDLARLAYYLV